MKLQQAYATTYQSLLCGTDCFATKLVPVPVDYGIDKLLSLDDLATGFWLEDGHDMTKPPRNNLTDLESYQFTVTHFPTRLPLQLKNAYTFFKAECSFVENRLISRHFVMNAPWNGNLLVVKHRLQEMDLIQDMKKEDVKLVNLIIKWLVNITELLPSLTTNY